MPYVGEIRIFAGNFPPRGWAFCDGQTLSAEQFPVLHARLGNRFGGEGGSFKLPDLRGRVAVQTGAGIALGEEGGTEIVALAAAQLPAHGHAIQASTGRANTTGPAGRAVATAGSAQYVSASGNASAMVTLAPTSAAGAGNAHANLQPYLCLNYIIALDGADQ